MENHVDIDVEQTKQMQIHCNTMEDEGAGEDKKWKKQLFQI